MKKKKSTPMSTLAKAIKYVPIEDRNGLRSHMTIERIFPRVPNTKKIVPIQTLVIKCILAAVSMSKASVMGVDCARSATVALVVMARDADVELILRIIQHLQLVY